VQITLTRTYGSSGPVSVDYYTEDVTALSLSLDSNHAVDYEKSTGTVSFASGQVEASFLVSVYPNPFATDQANLFRILLVNSTHGATLHADRSEPVSSRYLSSEGQDWFAYCEVEIFHDSRLVPLASTQVTYEGFLHTPETL